MRAHLKGLCGVILGSRLEGPSCKSMESEMEAGCIQNFIGIVMWGPIYLELGLGLCHLLLVILRVSHNTNTYSDSYSRFLSPKPFEGLIPQFFRLPQ